MSQPIILVCPRLSSNPPLIGAIASCPLCGEAIGMTPASRKRWHEQPGTHRVICLPCYQDMTRKSDRQIIEDAWRGASPEMLEEIRQELTRRITGRTTTKGATTS